METLHIVVDESSVWNIGTPSAHALNLPFYLLEYGHFIAFDGYYTQRERSKQYLLFYTLSGEGKLNYCGTEYRLPKNSVCIIWCDPLHSYSTVSGEPWDFLWFHFNGTAAKAFYDLYNDTGSLTIQQIPSSAIETVFATIATKPDNNISNNLLQNELITRFMTALIQKKLRLEQNASPEITGKINSAIVYMQDNLDKKLSIDDIAAHVFTSKYYFLHTFKKQIGVSPYNYLLYLRISKVKQLLLTTDLQLSEIAQQTGFCDSKNLIYNFKKITQITPAQYRSTNMHILPQENTETSAPAG